VGGGSAVSKVLRALFLAALAAGVVALILL
jgi:hypothetical protein